MFGETQPARPDLSDLVRVNRPDPNWLSHRSGQNKKVGLLVVCLKIYI